MFNIFLNSFQQTQTFAFLIALYLFTFQACPFDNYEDALIPQNLPLQITEINKPFESVQGDSIQIGFWSICIPQLKFGKSPTIDNLFNAAFNEEGQLLIIIKQNQEYKIFGYLELDTTYQTIKHKFITQNQEEVIFDFPVENYEGVWIFTLITIQKSLNSLIIELKDQYRQIIQIEFSSEPIKIFIGGSGYINNKKNLQLFKGRLSKLIFWNEQFYNENQYFEYELICQIPKLYQDEQIIQLINGLIHFDGNLIISKQILQQGDKFYVSGWIKHEFSTLVTQMTCPLIRISTRQNYGSFQLEGDQLLLVVLNVYPDSKALSSLSIMRDYHTFPKVQEILATGQFDIKIVSSQTWVNDFFDALQQWHFFRYEYGKIQSIVQFYFANVFGLQEGAFGIGTIQQTNSIYYINLGGDDTYQNLLSGQLYDFKFQFNYENEKERYFKTCHFSCLTCDGPYNYNCLSCYPNSNREYISEMKKCQCQQGYLEQNLLNCQSFSQYFQSIIVREDKQFKLTNCMFGYFLFPRENNSQQCIQCPYFHDQNYLCLNCLLNSNKWYEKPICTKDLNSQQIIDENTFSEQQRDSIEFDVYFIDKEGLLTFYPQFQNFCDPEVTENCFQSKQQHLEKQTYVICKPNYYLKNNECIFSNPYCLKVENNGNCQESINGMYFTNNQYFECPIQCPTCYYDENNKKIVCLECLEKYSLINGECKQCGQNCKICKNYYDQMLQKEYLRCFQCNDNQLYFISFDAINCLENTIKHCLYAFQADILDIKINTLDLDFSSRTDTENIITHCAKCQKINQIYIFKQRKCLQGTVINCDFGFAEEICDIPIDDEFQNSMDTYLYYYYDNQILQIGYDGLTQYCTTEQFCLVEQQLSQYTVQFNTECPSHTKNCATCISGRSQLYNGYQFSAFICLICDSGYYLEKVSSKCLKCPQDLNCYQCYQGQKDIQDDWKINTRAFYKQFIEKNNEHPYILYGQSQNLEDYQIFCLICIKGYELKGQKCIKSCPESCLDCKLIDFKNICLKCQKNEQGRLLSLFDNQCIECPKNCALCRKRTEEEIQIINPLFNSQIYQTYSNQCLKSFKGENYYYDQIFSAFIECDEEIDCSKQFIIPLNLYCSKKQYEENFNKQQSQEQRVLFKQSNILIDDLVSSKSFTEFENDFFYSQANEKQIKSIIIQITSDHEQICIIQSDVIIQQIFSQHVFTAIDVQLNLTFTKEIYFQYDQTITFKNFNQIYIEGLIMNPRQNNQIKQIIFSSIFLQIINLRKNQYQQSQILEDHSSLIFNNISELIIENFYIQNLFLRDLDFFFYVNQTENFKKIQLKDFIINSSIFIDSTLFMFQINPLDQIIFQNFEIKSKFQNSTFIFSLSQINQGFMELKNILIQSTISDSIFMNLYKFRTLDLQQLKLEQSSLTNVTFILLNSQLEISDLLINNCTFYQNSIFLSNTNMRSQEIHFYNLKNVQIINNQYQQDCQYLQIQKFDNQLTTLIIIDIYLSNNYLLSIPVDFNSQNIKSSLIYFEQDFLEIQNLIIERGYGLAEISITESKQIILQNISISQSEKFQFLGIHQFLDCQLQQSKGIYYLQSIRIVSVSNIQLVELNINNVQSYNSPIISIQSVDQLYDQRFETIIINNATIQNNLLLLTKIENPISIIQIISKQNVMISFINVNFQANILHQYIQDYLSPSALLLNLDTYKGYLKLLNSNIISNSVYNSSDSILKINCKKIDIENCFFDSNSLFNYEIIQPYLLWGFQTSQDIYVEDLQKIFKISSLSGNGLITVEKLRIINSTIQNSKGLAGGGLKVFLQAESQVYINQVKFYNLQNLFENEIEYGGSLCINGESSQTLIIEIKNITVRNVFSRSYGGFLYANLGEIKAEINIEQINLYDVYSQQGSIIYLTFSAVATQFQSMEIKKVQVYFMQSQTANYFDLYFGKKLSVNEFERIANNMTLFYLENSKQIVLEDINVENILYQSFLQAVDVNNIVLSKVSIKDSFMANSLIDISPKKNLLQYVLLNNFFLENIKIGQSINELACENIIDDETLIYYQCLTKSQLQQSPKVLKNRDINQNNNYGKCLINKIGSNLNLNQQGFLQLQNLNNLTQLKMSQLQITNIDCTLCQYGLIYLNYIDYVSSNQTFIQNLKIQNSQCGYLGCLNVQMSSQQSNRILTQEMTNFLKQNQDVEVSEYICTNNTSNYGVCLYVDDIKIYVKNSKISNNIAQQNGGGIFIKGLKEIIIYQTLISENSANVGGGIYYDKQSSAQFDKLQTLIQNNIAKFYGNDISSIPNKLRITFNYNKQYLNSKPIIQNNSLVIEQMTVEQFKQFDGTFSNDIHLPSGQQISTYRFFDWKNNHYIQLEYIFRILAFNQENEIQQNLTNSFCEINSRIFNISLDDALQEYQNNHTNLKIVYFNSTTNDYNLDNLIIYFNNQLPSEIYLQLEFLCSSILIPIYNQEFPYNIKQYHKNYKFRMNVKSFQCQFGEIRNDTDYSCIPCDGNLDLFSLTLNSQKCEIKDDVSTKSVQSAQLNLKPGYWRPYFDTKDVNYCLNLPLNCNGGWSYGYQSCYLGHIGALCEQCDLYDIRGDGQFSISEQYTCGSCLNQQRNIIIIIFVSLWTFFLIILSVQSSLKIIKEQVKSVNIKALGFMQIQDQNYSAILMKMLTNYFQIISSIATFQLQISIQLSTLINTVGSPIKAMVYSLDCFLVNIFNFSILYSRMLWQLLMPYFYIAIFFVFYIIGVKFNYFSFNKSVLTTSIIYVYIYLQPSLIGGLVELLSYREISSFKWILGNVSYRYDTDEHLQWMLKFCLPVLIILAFMIPLFFLNRLFYNRSKFDEKQTRYLWGFLYNEYKKEAYFWEIVKIFQKEIIITFLIYYDQNIVVKATIITLILLLYLELQKQYQPYNSYILNSLDYYQTIVCIISMILAAGIYIAQKSESYEIIFFYATSLGAINLYFLFILILKILNEYIKVLFTNFENELDKIRDFLRVNFKTLNKFPYFRKQLKNRAQQKQKLQKLYQKLKKFLLPQAKQIIIFKQYQYQKAILAFSSEENQDYQLSSMRTFQSEKQTLIQKNFQLIQSLSRKNLTQLSDQLENLNERKYNQSSSNPIFHQDQLKLIQESQENYPKETIRVTEKK